MKLTHLYWADFHRILWRDGEWPPSNHWDFGSWIQIWITFRYSSFDS